jgi:2-amino-4-hydroxy-6-hydroxymethyldihydropteridine diphosphokinase
MQRAAGLANIDGPAYDRKVRSRVIFIAIGANLPSCDGVKPLESCRRAAVLLGDLPGLRLTGLSRWYETAPMPPSGQPSYINGVARLEGAIEPEPLLAALQRIEHAFGRVRTEVNAARTLDLDIIAMGDLIRAAPDPILPHPRMHVRAFVLAPLLDLAPDWRHPVLGQSARALLAGLPDQGVFALAMSTPPD